MDFCRGGFGTRLTRLSSVTAIIVLCAIGAGCAMKKGERKLFVPLESGEKTCTLVFENPLRSSPFGELMVPTVLVIDGFMPCKWDSFKCCQTSSFKIPVGNHQILVAGAYPFQQSQSAYRPDGYCRMPLGFVTLLDINVDTQADKTYKIKVEESWSIHEVKYRISYEGWPADDMEAWPTDKAFKNPIFGMIREKADKEMEA